MKQNMKKPVFIVHFHSHTDLPPNRANSFSAIHNVYTDKESACKDAFKSYADQPISLSMNFTGVISRRISEMY